MEISIIYGSVRESREGIKAARFLEKELKKRKHKTHFIDPKELNLPLLDKMHKEYEKPPKNMETISNKLSKSDGIVIVSAEYNHSIPPALKNTLDHFQKEYLYKPSALCTYSAGIFGGVRGLANLRTIMSELGAVSIPTIFPIPKIQDGFEIDGTPKDEAYYERVKKFLTEFEWYMEAFKMKREQEKR